MTPPGPQDSAVPGRPSRAAATAALQAYVATQKGDPLRRALQEALREADKLGGQERRFVAFATRELLRHQALVDWAAKQMGSPPGALVLDEDRALVRYVLWRRLVTKAPWAKVLQEVKLPGPLRPRSIADAKLQAVGEHVLEKLGAQVESLDPSIRHSFPKWLTEKFARAVPAEQLAALLESLNQEPELILRVRAGGSAATVQEELTAEGVQTGLLGLGTDALSVTDSSRKVFDSRVFRENRLQVQDLGSQLIVQLCRPRDGFTGKRIADVCAGAGGKTLYLADLVGPTGQVDALDASARRLGEARERVRDWGVKQVRFPSQAALDQADVVLVDAPCSGSGSLGREPDQKWKLNQKAVEGWVETQRKLLEETSRGLKEGATLVYATCSLLPEENEQQVEQFLQRHPEWTLVHAQEVLTGVEVALAGPYLRLLPHRVPGGAFFAARLERSPNR